MSSSPYSISLKPEVTRSQWHLVRNPLWTEECTAWQICWKHVSTEVAKDEAGSVHEAVLVQQHTDVDALTSWASGFTRAND